MVKTVVGTFDSISEASAAARDVRNAGFLPDDVNVVANNTQRLAGDTVRTTDTTETKTSGAATGVLTGGALGGVVGLAASLMGLAIPGIGPILAAGPIAAALAGAGAGAVAGGLIGGLTDMGVPEEHAQYYAEAVRRGGALVTVRVDESRSDEAERILREHGAYDIEDRVVQWRSEGWNGYNPNAEPYSFEEVERERTRYSAGANPTTGTQPRM